MSRGRFLYDSIGFLKTFSFRKGWNLFLLATGYLVSLLTGRPVVWGMPHTLSAEPATFCNLSCPECPVGNHTFLRPAGEMSMDLFRRMTDQVAGTLLHLILYFQGEPFLARNLFDMIAYARAKNIYVSTSTNGHYLDERSIKGILSSGLNRLIISLDGASQETYERYRVGGDFEKVVRGIRELIQQRNAGNYRKPFVVLQFLMFRHNLHEMGKIKELAGQLGVDRLEFKTAQFYDLSGNNRMIPEDPSLSRYRREGDHYVLKYKLKNHCPRLWNTAVTTWDGRMVPCCFDKQAAYVLGDLNNEHFRKIWFSRPYNRFRQQILTARHEVAMCRNCTEGLGRSIASRD